MVLQHLIVAYFDFLGLTEAKCAGPGVDGHYPLCCRTQLVLDVGSAFGHSDVADFLSESPKLAVSGSHAKEVTRLGV